MTSNQLSDDETQIQKDESSSKLSSESFWVSMPNGEQLHLRRVFSKEKLNQQNNVTKVFLLHGEALSGDIFFKNKFADLIGKEGYDVFVPDLAGRGRSLGSDQGYSKITTHQIITEGIPRLINRAKDINIYKKSQTNNKSSHKIILIAHGFNSCLLTAAWSRLDKPSRLNTYMVFIGAHRRLSRKNILSKIKISLLKNNLILRLIKYYGKFPAKKLNFGLCDENIDWFSYYRDWIDNQLWIDLDDKFNYKKAMRDCSLPSSLYFSYSKDGCFGSIEDTRKFIEDQGMHDARIHILNKKYESILSDSCIVNEILPRMINWFKEINIYPKVVSNSDFIKTKMSDYNQTKINTTKA